MKGKDGRPPRSIAAWRALHARDELETRFPDVVALIELLGSGNVDLEHVEAALSQALASIATGPSRTREELPADATPVQSQLHEAAEVERLSQDRDALAKLGIAVASELATVTSALATAETQLRSAMLKREPIDQHAQVVLNKLVAAGLTAKTSRTMSSGQVNQIRDILNGDEPAVTPRPVWRHRQTAQVALAWKLDNSWVGVLNGVSDYRFDKHPASKSGVDVASLRSCGLPPFSDLESFGYPALYGAFEAAKDPRARMKACWRICAKWVADHITDESGVPNVEAMRERAWSFLFGVRYGFAHEIGTLARVGFPSPWKKDEQVIANRRD